MEQEKQLLIKYGKKLVDEGYTVGTGGNLSRYNRDLNLMAITPTGIDFFNIQPEDIVIMKTDGTIVESSRKPSSEWMMHKLFYERRTDINAVIHAHTIYSTVLAELRWTLPASHYMIAIAGQDVRCAEYATYGTAELAENAFRGMKDRKAVFLANHGLLVGEATIETAYNVLEQVEYCANIYCKAKSLGDPVILDDAEMQRMQQRFKTYGQGKSAK
jgi:L-fuculose-phosphate aldolase